MSERVLRTPCAADRPFTQIRPAENDLVKLGLADTREYQP